MLRTSCIVSLIALCVLPVAGRADEEPLVRAVASVRPAVVAVGVYRKRPEPVVRLLATGFVVDKAGYVLTNAHVVRQLRRHGNKGDYHIFFADRPLGEGLPVAIVAEDKLHDLALLAFAPERNRPVAAVRLGQRADAKLGQGVGVYGFPMAAGAGLHGSVSHGIVSSVAPVTLPGHEASEGGAPSPRRTAYNLLHLDLRALPGNSGSPVFRVSDGKVIGVVSMIAGLRTDKPGTPGATGITYAVGADHIAALLATVRKGRQ